jgi:hypothetical protein
MNRRLTFGLVVVFVTAFIVAACGRQVTPNPPGLGAGGAPPGYLAIHFDVAAPFNFSNYRYLVVFNTSGSGVTPSTDTQQTNWAGYSSALIALGNGVTSSAELVKFFRPIGGHGPPGWQTQITTPQQFTFNLNSNGTGTEFSMLVQKVIVPPSPSPSPSATPSNKWTFNAFSVQSGPQSQWLFSDSLGAGGPVDPQFVSPILCMTEPFDNTYFARFSQVPDPAAQIVSVEISNNPSSPAPCP